MEFSKQYQHKVEFLVYFLKDFKVTAESPLCFLLQPDDGLTKI